MGNLDDISTVNGNDNSKWNNKRAVVNVINIRTANGKQYNITTTVKAKIHTLNICVMADKLILA